MTKSRKVLMSLTLAVAVTGAASWWTLVNPDNAFTRLFARDISDINARIVIGPYPAERDFRLLKANNVGLIVTLLNPAIPYEATLLAQERERASRFGIRLESFPMSSILGQRFGTEYDQNAANAAAAIAGTTQKVYLHCYLGMHRIQVVRDLLAARGIESGTYSVRKGERSDARLQIDAAEAAYAAGRHQEALTMLAKLDTAAVTMDVTLLRGWCLFQLNRLSEAATAFSGVLTGDPGNTAATTGLGYCALRAGDNDAAQRHFSTAAARSPDHADALGGLGLALSRLGRLREAETAFVSSLALAPNAEFEDALKRVRADLASEHPGGRR